MSNSLQILLVIVSVGLAIGFLVTKFIWKPRKKAKGSCGDDDCGCH